MELWLIWKQPTSRRRYKIGTLLIEQKQYTFRYDDEINDAKSDGFTCFPGFEDINKTYESTSMFPNIFSRLPNKKRPDYKNILMFYNLKEDASDDEILAATKGKLVTDNYEFVQAFNEKNILFDIVGTRHSKDLQKCLHSLKKGMKISLELDKTNEHDKYAIKVLLESMHIGFVPRYYSKNLTKLLEKNKDYNAIIENVNFENVLSDEEVIIVVRVIIMSHEGIDTLNKKW